MSFMKNIAIIARYGSAAIWNCMKQHIELIEEAGYTTFIYVNKEIEDLSVLTATYREKVILYSSKKELYSLMDKNQTQRIWIPEYNSAFYIATYAIRRNIPITYWVQGTVPDESYMRHGSKLKKLVLYSLEKIAFTLSSSFVYVSDAMASFYDKKHCKKKPYIVVPCISEYKENDIIKERIKNSYVYIGGMSVWQCFEDTLRLYLKISSKNSIFHVITRETNKAEKIVAQIAPNHPEIKIYPITDRNQIPNVLSQFEYGFLIRKSNPVNYVASPIKFLEYISCGVNVIMTDAVPYYADIIKKYNIGTVVSLSDQDIKINMYNTQARNIYKEVFNKIIFIDRYKQILK